MNRKIASFLAISAAAAAFAGNAFADDITVDTTPFNSTRTRAEVQADIATFKQAGTSVWSTQYNPLTRFKSGLTREQVAAEYRASRDQVAAFNSEDSGSAYISQYTFPANRNASTTLAGQPRNAQ